MIVHPDLVTVKIDNQGKEILTPRHFFKENSFTSFGVGSREPKPEFILDKKDNAGLSMVQFGLSN